MIRSKTLIIAMPLMAVLLGVVAYRYGYVTVRGDIQSIKEDQVMRAKTLQKYIELIGEKPLLEKKFTALTEERKTDSSNLIEGQTLSLAAATLQDTVKGIISSGGGSISSERVGKPEDFGKFRTITVIIDAVVPDSRTLSDILYSIETRTPYLVVKEIDLSIRDFRNPRELMVKLNVSAMTAAR